MRKATARLLCGVGVAVAPVASPKERIDEDPSTAAWGLWPEVVHTELGPLRVEGVPVHLSATDWRITKAAPCLGEDNERVFSGLLGHSREELAELAAAGVI